MAREPNILIVDDEPAVLRALQLAFEDAPWRVEVAVSHRTAMEAYRRVPFDLMVVDKNLPDGSGVELIREIRCEDHELRFIMITGYASAGSALETANLGVEAYLEKPFRDIFAVRDTVEEVLGRPANQLASGVQQLFANPRESKPPQALQAEEAAAEAAGDASSDMLDVVIASADRPAGELIVEHLTNWRTTCRVTSPAGLSAELKPKVPAVILVCGGRGVLGAVQRVRDESATVPIVVIAERLGVQDIVALILLQVVAIIDDRPDSAKFRIRLWNLLAVVRKQRALAAPG